MSFVDILLWFLVIFGLIYSFKTSKDFRDYKKIAAFTKRKELYFIHTTLVFLLWIFAFIALYGIYVGKLFLLYISVIAQVIIILIKWIMVRIARKRTKEYGL